MPRPTTIDFETFPAQSRPEYPPKPVGVAIKPWGKKARYYAWGHPVENNSTFEEARRAVREAWATPDGILCHSGKFDVDVAETYMGVKRLPWDKMHDSLFLLFLDNPHSIDLGLKPACEKLLHMAPEERDAVGDWLIANQPVPGVRISRSRNSEYYFGAYIAYAPGKLVGAYACGDVNRAEGLFKHLWPKTVERGMLGAYDRERRLMPILLGCERQGVPVDVAQLEADVAAYSKVWERVDHWVHKQLKATDLNIDSGAQLIKALLSSGKADEKLLGLTATGKFKSDKESLEACITDPVLSAVLRYRAQLKTCMNTFMTPWLTTAQRSKGLIYTNWNQTRNASGDGTVGARTGRLSSTPNFQNIPNMFKPIFKHDVTDAQLRKVLARAPFALPSLPLVRGYIVPPHKDYVLIDRDYSQQELRILAHFEDGKLKSAYHENPWLDVHDHARELINRMLNKNFERKPIKNTGFGIIYGMGNGTLAEKSDITVELAKEVKRAYLATFPGLKAMYDDMKYRAKNNLPLRTWGGREYYCEEPKIINGRICTFEYKMVNVLVQGSAADCTKEGVIRYDDDRPKDHFLYLNVHDELLSAVPRKDIARGVNKLRTAMESVEFDVPMLSEGTWSPNSWIDLRDYDKKGVLLYAA